MLLGLMALILSICLMFGVQLRYVAFSGLLEEGSKKWLLVGYGVLFAINTAVIWLILHQEAWMRMLRHDYFLFPLITALFNICVIKKRTKEHLFVYGIVITCNFVLVSLVTFVMEWLPEMDDKHHYLAAAAVYLLLLILFFQPERWLLRYTVEPFLTMDNGNYWGTIWFIPIAMYFAMLFASLGAIRVDSIYQIVGRGLIGCATVLVCLSVARDHGSMRTMQAMSERLSMQKEQYDSMVERVNDARRIRHDHKHLYSAVRGYVEAGDKDGLFRFGQDLVARGDESYGVIPYTGNVAADGVIYHYARRIEGKDIKLELVGVIKSPGISDMDLSVLLGNALDNALAGCMTVEAGRFISVAVQSEEYVLSILVRNSFDGVVDTRDEKLLSRKRNNAPGIGIASMEEICRRNGGSMQLQWDERVFSVLFVLPVCADEADKEP